MTRLDYLGECNDQKVPLEDFRLAFCVRCFQKDCSRSQFGTSKFEARVNTWEERLFQAPQLPKNDPRYPVITAKRFLTLAAGPTPSVREWIDPQTLDTSPPAPQATPAVPPETPVPQQSPPVQAPPVQPQPPVVSVPEEPKSPPPETRPRQNLFVNTPYTGPRTLANQPTSQEKPRDAWATPEPVKSGEKVIKPGARVKIGGSG